MPETVAMNWKDERRNLRRSQDDQPIQYEVDTEKRLVVVRFIGEVTVRKIARYVAHLKTNPGFHRTFGEMVDLRGVQQIDLQPDDFLRLADKIDPFSPEAKRAFVVGNTFQNHAAQMHKILRPKRNIEIFESFEQAETWVRK